MHSKKTNANDFKVCDDRKDKIVHVNRCDGRKKGIFEF